MKFNMDMTRIWTHFTWRIIPLVDGQSWPRPTGCKSRCRNGLSRWGREIKVNTKTEELNKHERTWWELDEMMGFYHDLRTKNGGWRWLTQQNWDVRNSEGYILVFQAELGYKSNQNGVFPWEYKHGRIYDIYEVTFGGTPPHFMGENHRFRLRFFSIDPILWNPNGAFLSHGGTPSSLDVFFFKWQIHENHMDLGVHRKHVAKKNHFNRKPHIFQTGKSMVKPV